MIKFNKYVYRLTTNDGFKIFIIGDRKLDLHGQIRQALKVMTNAQISDPAENWFASLIDQVCDQTGFDFLSVDDDYNVSDDYLAELRHRRSQNDPSHL